MKKVSDIIAMEVVDSGGNPIGEVERVLCSRTRGRIMGITLKQRRPVRGNAVIHYKDILSLGDDLIIVNNRSTAGDGSDHGEMDRGAENEDVTGYTVLNADGKEMGKITDTVISEANGSIEGYLVAGDLFVDLIEGRKLLRLERSAIVGNGSIMLDHEAEGKDLQKKGGLKSLLKLND